MKRQDAFVDTKGRILRHDDTIAIGEPNVCVPVDSGVGPRTGSRGSSVGVT